MSVDATTRRAGSVFGACAGLLYALCVAHANDQALSDTFFEVSGDLLVMFAVGVVVGPYLAALMMTALGHAGIFIFTAGMHLTVPVYTILRINSQPQAPVSEKAPYVVIRKTTQAVLPLDPHSPSSVE